MDRAELIAESKDCEMESEKAVKEAIGKHKEFLKLYPYREHPEDIDLLTRGGSSKWTITNDLRACLKSLLSTRKCSLLMPV